MSSRHLTAPDAIAEMSTSPNKENKLSDIQSDSAWATIALVGHPYLLYDEYINHRLIHRLEQNHIKVITPEMVSAEQLEIGLQKMEEKAYWAYEDEVTCAGGHFLQSRVDGIIGRLEESRFYDQLDSTMQNLQLSSERIASFSNKLNTMMEDLNSNESTLGAILKDSLMAEEFRQTLQNLNRGSELLNEDLEALRHNFLTRKYFKKQEKEAKKSQKSKD